MASTQKVTSGDMFFFGCPDWVIPFRGNPNPYGNSIGDQTYFQGCTKQSILQKQGDTKTQAILNLTSNSIWLVEIGVAKNKSSSLN